MDRNLSKFAHRLGMALALAVTLQAGPGCSRMRKYRSQDSPMPGMPLLGLGRRASAEGRSARAGDARAESRPDVAWSGPPNTAPPLSRLGPPRDSNSRSVAIGDAPRPAKAAASVKIAADPAVAKIREIVRAGRAHLGATRTYQVAMNRQERVGGGLQPVEDVLLSIRREPRAVRLEWPDGPHKGREVLYSAAEPGGVMHVNMADSILPVPPMTLPTDSPLVMKNSRHPITEAGLGAILDRLDETLKSHESGAAGADRLTYDGLVTPPEIGRPCHKVTRVTAAGETWIIDFDAATSLPMFVQETAADGGLMERYVFHDFVADPPALADASAFDPDRRWGSARGLFGRLAQGTSANPAPK